MQRDTLSVEVPLAAIRETEPDFSGRSATCMTIFLTASQCPIGCTMCDLWKNTLSTPTPPGAIPKQIDHVLRSPLGKAVAEESETTRYLKLYNSGNFFDSQSIPPSDDAAIADRCRSFDRVIVENHPRIGAKRLLRFQKLLDAQLEVAVGLETVQPRWLQRMEKRMTRDEFDAYARFLQENRIDLRVFLIVGVPGVDARESIRWAKLSVRHAVLVGARHISLIPARTGHGWNGQADLLPTLGRDHLRELHQTASEDASGNAIVTLDTWKNGDSLT